MATKKKLLQVSGGGGDDYWIALLGGTTTDIGYEVAADSQNNIIVTGRTLSAGAGSNDFLTAKYDASGTLLWSKAYGSSSSESSYRLVIDSSDNIIVAGTTSYQSNVDCLLVKYNSAGTLQWAKLLGRTSSSEYFYGVTVDSSDNIYATGYTDHGSAGQEVLATKYNSSGTLQWQYKMGSTGTEFGRSASIDSSGNIIISGYTTSFGQGGTDALLVKLNSSGSVTWARSLGSTSTDQFFHATVDSSDNIIAVGRSVQDSYYETIVAKYSSSGNLLWIKALSDTGILADYGYNVITDSSDNIYISALAGSSSDGNDIIVAKFNSSGTLLMQKRLGGTNNDAGYGIGLDLDDNILATGYTVSDGAGSNDIFVAKLPPDGSGDGTYGNLTYQDASLTVSTPGVTSSPQTITAATANNTDSTVTSVLTETTLSLTEELFVVT